MNLVRSTIHEHRKRSLELLKQIMEANTDEKKPFSSVSQRRQRLHRRINNKILSAGKVKYPVKGQIAQPTKSICPNVKIDLDRLVCPVSRGLFCFRAMLYIL